MVLAAVHVKLILPMYQLPEKTDNKIICGRTHLKQEGWLFDRNLSPSVHPAMKTYINPIVYVHIYASLPNV